MHSTIPVKPDLHQQVEKEQEKQEKQEKQKELYDSTSCEGTFQVKDIAYVRNLTQGFLPLWLPGVTTAVVGPRSFQITFSDGHIFRRHTVV